MNKSTAEWRAELLKIYDDAYERTRGTRPTTSPKPGKKWDEGDDEGGASVREPRRPKPNAPSEVLEATP